MQDLLLLIAASVPSTISGPFDWLFFPAIAILVFCIAFVAWWFFFKGKKPSALSKKNIAGTSRQGAEIFKKIFGHFEKAKANSLYEKKRQLLQELEVAEQKFMKREILEENYKNLVGKKQQELIQIDTMLSKQVPAKEISKSELTEVEPKNRHLLKELFEKKQKCQQEMELAQNRYFKRKIDEKTYQSIVNSCQAKIIEIDGRIRSIKTTQDIKQAFFDLKEKLKVEQQDFAQKEQAEIERIAKEILAQIEKSKNNHF
jgi:uncharacterized membrane protein